ncbi:MAG: glycosyltransferase family 4 protein [Candidatus Obscuribacterales bacterium]|nr:glycosyltransferase family 4 protein [Candidatus Obscuribacterales bacterium]
MLDVEPQTSVGPRIRIAMVMRQFSTAGGLELYAHKLIERLLEQNVHVTVVCEKNESALQSADLAVVQFKVKKGGNKSERLQNLYDAASAALKNAGAFDVVHSQHCPVDGADVVTFHNHTTSRLSIVGLDWERVLNDCKRVLVPAYRLRNHFDELLCRKATCLVFPADVMQKDFYEAFPFLKVQNKPHVIAHPGADLAVETSAVRGIARESTASSTFNFLFVGRGFRKKGLDVLLEACKILKSRERDFRLSIAGLNEKFADRLRLGRLGLKESVCYLGFCKNMDEVYGRSQVLVLPSRVEPFGMAPVQAMQRGLVPIVSRVCGVAEVLKSGHDSLLLENHLSAAELANCMERLMDDDILRDRLSRNAVETARAVSWDVTAERTLAAYKLVRSLKCGTAPGAADERLLAEGKGSRQYESETALEGLRQAREAK